MRKVNVTLEIEATCASDEYVAPQVSEALLELASSSPFKAGSYDSGTTIRFPEKGGVTVKITATYSNHDDI